jgi:hypothetical protein
MIEYGFDAANAPDAATAKSILTDIGGSWVAVYVGGIDLAPIARKTWTPQRVREYVAAGITQFLPIYVPREPLTRHRSSSTPWLACGTLDG